MAFRRSAAIMPKASIFAIRAEAMLENPGPQENQAAAVLQHIEKDSTNKNMPINTKKIRKKKKTMNMKNIRNCRTHLPKSWDWFLTGCLSG